MELGEQGGEALRGIGGVVHADQSLLQGLGHLMELSVAHELLLSVLHRLQPLTPLWVWGGEGCTLYIYIMMPGPQAHFCRLGSGLRSVRQSTVLHHTQH